MMTPEEKANQLLYQFSTVADNKLSDAETKAICLLCVNEILRYYPRPTEVNETEKQFYDYWLEVKNKLLKP